MRSAVRMLTVLGLLAGLAACGGGGGGGGSTDPTSSSGSGSGSGTTPVSNQVAPPTITTQPAQNGAVIVSLATTTSGAVIHYTMDGSTPTASSPTYLAPVLVASNLTVKAIAQATGLSDSTVSSQSFSPNLGSGVLVWSDEFNNTGTSPARPDPTIWNIDTGQHLNDDQELETYCAWASSTSPCDANNPNTYVGTDGYLHIVARQPSSSVYTSGSLRTAHHFSFQYGRFEVRAKVPEAQGLWPAVWLMGNTFDTLNWPACGEMDVLERVNAALSPDWNQGSIHGPGYTGSNLGAQYHFPSGTTASDWHTYGMIWKPGSVSYYVDDPTNPYITYTTASISGFSGATWPFDSGPSFIIMNLAVGGSWPGPPNGSTPFPSEMLVDYVRIYTN